MTQSSKAKQPDRQDYITFCEESQKLANELVEILKNKQLSGKDLNRFRCIVSSNRGGYYKFTAVVKLARLAGKKIRVVLE